MTHEAEAHNPSLVARVPQRFTLEVAIWLFREGDSDWLVL